MPIEGDKHRKFRLGLYVGHMKSLALLLIMVMVAGFNISDHFIPVSRRSAPLTITITSFRTAKNLMSGSWGYGPTFDFTPPHWTYVICHVNIVYDGMDKGAIKCAPNWFKLDTTSNYEDYQSFRFDKKHPPEHITSLPDTELKLGDSISGDLVFEIIEGDKLLRAEYSVPKNLSYIKSPNSIMN